MRSSAATIDQTEIPVSAVLHPPLPPTNLYFLSVSRIHEVKYGPFHEHSSQLYSIATGVQYWHKVNSGLFKMYEVSCRQLVRSVPLSRSLQAEVLSKRVVVQHLLLGGLVEWDSPDSAVSAAHVSAQAELRPSTPPTPTPASAAQPSAATIPPPIGRSPERPAPPPFDVRSVAPTVGGQTFAQNHPSGIAGNPRAAAALRQGGPIVGSAMHLGPLANTTLRPISRGPTNMPPPKPGLS